MFLQDKKNIFMWVLLVISSKIFTVMGKLIRKILTVILLIFYLGVGIFTIAFASEGGDNLQTAKYLGLLVLLSSIVHIILYFIHEGYKNKDKMFYLILGLIGLSLGIVFMVNKNATVEEICLYWGILDVVRGSVEMAHSIPEVKENKLQILEVAISLGDIILGILLCINRGSGITAHLIYLGIAFIVTAIKIVVDYVIEYNKTKETK